MYNAYIGIKTHYKEVEYIESTGTQWIDTGVIANQDTKLVADYQFISTTDAQFGCGNAADTNRFVVSAGSPNFLASIGTNVTTTVPFDTNRHTFILDAKNKIVQIDQTSVGVSYSSLNSQYTIAFFCRWDQYGPDFIHSGRLYSAQIYSDGTLIKDFQPIRIDTGEYCLLDKLSNTIYRNIGNGSFTGNAADGDYNLNLIVPRRVKKGYYGKNFTYTTAEYLESSGTQYIDTGVVPKSTTRMVYDFAVSEAPSKSRIGWGSQSSAESFFMGGWDNEGGFYASCSHNWGDVKTYIVEDTDRHVWDVSNAALKFDGVTYGTGTIGDTASSGQTLYLFAFHTEWSPGIDYVKHKMYSCKIYDGDKLIRDYIPVLDENNVPCLLEMVEMKLCYNNGTGTFLYGPTQETSFNIPMKLSVGYVGIARRYTPIEYLESTGTQYINTSYTTASANTKIIIDCEITSGVYAFGGGGSSYTSWAIRNNSGSYQARMRTGTWNTASLNTGVAIGSRHTFELTSPNVYVDGESVGSFSSGFGGGSAGAYYLFSTTDSPSSNTSVSKIYSFKVYEESVLKLDFVPALDENDVPCMYDRLNDKFYYNIGTGNFTAGPKSGETIIIDQKAHFMFHNAPFKYELIKLMSKFQSSGSGWDSKTFSQVLSDAQTFVKNYGKTYDTFAIFMYQNNTSSHPKLMQIFAFNKRDFYSISNLGNYTSMSITLKEGTNGVKWYSYNNSTSTSRNISGSSGGLYWYFSDTLKNGSTKYNGPWESPTVLGPF